jgi:hypothetical protein
MTRLQTHPKSEDDELETQEVALETALCFRSGEYVGLEPVYAAQGTCAGKAERGTSGTRKHPLV